MAQQPSVKKPWKMAIPHGLYAELKTHLFPGDGDEHGAIILAGIAESERAVRLLAKELHLAKDGRDFVPGKRSYRTLRGEFITDHILKARDECLVYLAIHNHSGTSQVAFSSTDLRSHERGYPALLQITRGVPVGALVFAEDAIAGDIWLSANRRVNLDSATVVGARRKILAPSGLPRAGTSDHRYDRQVRLFGDRGQEILRKAKVAIVGVGGVGSLLAEYLGRLGVGQFVIVDPDHAESTNLPRLVGARPWDVAPQFVEHSSIRWIRAFGRKLAQRKVNLAKRNIRRANPSARIKIFAVDFVEADVARHVIDCDYIFLAANTMRARLLFNAIVHQYLIPGAQIGAKVVSDHAGALSDVYSVTRLVTPDSGCLHCSRFISAAKLQDEAISEKERRAQRYIDDPTVSAPSVITLNALASAQAANDFLFYMTGLTVENATPSYMRFRPLQREVWYDRLRSARDCPHCSRSEHSCFARGDGARLPVKL